MVGKPDFLGTMNLFSLKIEILVECRNKYTKEKIHFSFPIAYPSDNRSPPCEISEQREAFLSKTKCVVETKKIIKSRSERAGN